MNTEDVKLSGYVLRDKYGFLLTRKKVWKSEALTGGWIWSNEEVIHINLEIGGVFKKQAAYLSRATGQTVITGELEKV